MLGRLKVAEIVDDVVGPRRADAACSVGTYIALATANRVVDPRSKRAFSDWWAMTAGDRFVKLPAADRRQPQPLPPLQLHRRRHDRHLPMICQ
jgi:hypothetical protein